MKRKVALGALVAGGAVVSFLTGATLHSNEAHIPPQVIQRQPYQPTDDHSVTVEGLNCPTEDSCSIDYSHGKWTVTEVTP